MWYGGSSQHSWWSAGSSWPAEEDDDNADLMDAAEKSLQTQVVELLGSAQDRVEVNQADRLREAKLSMGKRDVTKADNIVEALQLLVNGTLDKNHKALQAARRNPAFAASSTNKEYVANFFEAELEKIVVQHVAV